MPGTAVVDSGNYDLQIATGFVQDAFTLDDAIKGVLDNTSYVLDGTTEFASVMDSVTTITVKRGRRDIGDTFSAGTMTFTIQDVDGIFNPFDENSPYYDTAESKPGLAPMREVKLIRYSSTDVPELLISAYVINYDYNFALGGLDSVTVYCADQFYLLSQTYLDEFNPSAETSGARIETVLDLPEVDFPALARDISTGTVNLGHDASYTVNAGTNVLQYIAQINDTAEFGRLFMSRDGVLTFQDRIGNTISASVADFHDDGTEYKYNGVGISFEADAVVNRVVVTGLNGNTATATDAGSIATYFIQTDSITNSLLHEQTSIDTAASYLLNPEPEARYTSVETAFLMLTTAQKDTLATLEIGDTITVEKTFPSGAGTTQLAQELSVEGIEHYLDFSTGHRVLYSTAPTTIVYELILDNATYGTLDAENVLGSGALMATPTTLPAAFVAGQVLTAAQQNALRGAFRVLQVVSTNKSDTFSVTSGSYTDVTGLSVSITPSATSSQILVIASINGSQDIGINDSAVQLVRGSTAIAIGDASGSHVQASTMFQAYFGGSSDFVGITFLDSPATTSATTYKIQVRSVTGSAITYINRSKTDNATGPRTVSSITVMEISA
jgi:hypothetical protein